MIDANPPRTVGGLIVDSLVANGIDRVFCVPGESYLGLLDALYGRPDIDTVVCRHEAGAGFMALADARLTGKPGVACVSRGPGASNAAIAVHTAQQDAVPFILLVGQVAARDLRRDSFQEIDYLRMFGGIAKWTAEVADPERVAETLLRAIQLATTGTPGPVIIALPEDVLTAPTTAATVRPQAPIRAAPRPSDIVTLRAWINAARRPLLLAGSGMEPCRDALRQMAETWNLPVLVSFRRHDLFDNAHTLYAGDMGLFNPASQMAVLREADLLLVLGARLSDITTQGFTFPEPVRPSMRLVHVHPDPGVIGVQFAADLAIGCDGVSLLAGLGAPGTPPPAREDWLSRLGAERRRIAAPRAYTGQDGISFERVVEMVARHLPPTGIVTLDAGSFAAPAYRVIPFAPPQRLLAPISGAMGFGVPAAVAAALRHPGRTVICMVGDGGVLMTGNELAVALERQLSIKVIVAENRSYGSIRIHQERDYPGRTIGTGLTNPDLEGIGRAFGLRVTRVRSTSDLALLADRLRDPGPEFILVEASLEAVLPSPGR